VGLYSGTMCGLCIRGGRVCGSSDCWKRGLGGSHRAVHHLFVPLQLTEHPLSPLSSLLNPCNVTSIPLTKPWNFGAKICDHEFGLCGGKFLAHWMFCALLEVVFGVRWITGNVLPGG
jgi:hypothetical protein